MGIVGGGEGHPEYHMIHDDRTFYFILYYILKFIFHVNFEVVGILRKCVNSTKTIMRMEGVC